MRSKSRQKVNGLMVFVSLIVMKYIIKTGLVFITGGVAQMVERSLSMREVPGSIPGASKIFHFSKSKYLGRVFL